MVLGASARRSAPSSAVAVVTTVFSSFSSPPAAASVASSPSPPVSASSASAFSAGPMHVRVKGEPRTGPLGPPKVPANSTSTSYLPATGA